MKTSASSATVPHQQGWFTRERLLTLALAGITILVLYICYLIVFPFLEALAWAAALAIVAHPIHAWIVRRVHHPGIGAGIAVVIVTVLILAPVAFVTNSIVQQASGALDLVQKSSAAEHWQATIERNPKLAPVLQWIEQQFDIQSEIDKAAKAVKARTGAVVTGSLWVATQLLITLFTLFYFFRDRHVILRTLGWLAPLGHKETKQVFDRLSDTVYATLYGSVTVALIQGTLGGLMFWMLGLPAPALWGAVMAVVSVIPMLGAFVIWLPAAIFLAVSGQVVKGMILLAWGAIAVGTIDNILYPVLVGKKLRMHPLPVFFSIVGGVILFGAAGLILGPVSLALLWALVEVWNERTESGQSSEQALEESR